MTPIPSNVNLIIKQYVDECDCTYVMTLHAAASDSQG